MMDLGRFIFALNGEGILSMQVSCVKVDGLNEVHRKDSVKGRAYKFQSLLSSVVGFCIFLPDSFQSPAHCT